LIRTLRDDPEQNWPNAAVRLILRLALIAGLIAGGVYALFRLKVIIVSLLVAGTLAYVMRPLASKIARKRILVPRRGNMHKRRVWATLHVLFLMFLCGYYTIRFMVNPFVEEVRNVADNWVDYQKRIEQYMKDFDAWYVAKVPPETRRWIDEQLAGQQKEGNLATQAAGYLGSTAKKVGEWAHYIIEIVLLPVLAFYFAIDSKKIKHEFVALVPRRNRREVLRVIHDFNQIMVSFIVGQAILCTLAGVFIGLLLLAMGVKYPLMLGLLAGITRAIPIIGPIIGGIPIVLMVLITKGVAFALVVLVLFTVLHFAESKFLLPWLIGERMELHPVVVIIVLLVGQEFGGLLGMFFAAPVAALIRVIVRRYLLRNHRIGAPA
jgi:predicted PurR-regulated permease PerM